MVSSLGQKKGLPMHLVHFQQPFPENWSRACSIGEDHQTVLYILVQVNCWWGWEEWNGQSQTGRHVRFVGVWIGGDNSACIQTHFLCSVQP